MCLRLGTESLREGTNPDDLASRIDSTLTTVHTAMSYHLEESNSVLARTRNRLKSPLLYFPEEILFEIFVQTIFDRYDRKGSKLMPLERSSRMIYRRLYNLLSVCTVWRDLILARGVLWSVIPIIESRSDAKHKAVKRILQRAGESALHLAASTLFTLSRRFTKVLSEYGPRFRTINFSTRNRYVIRDAIDRLLEHGTPGSLSELSIKFTNFSQVNFRLPLESDYIISHEYPRRTMFSRLTEALTAFRVCGTHFYWDTMTFSTRLVEFRIEEATLGYDDTISSFLQALSAAPNLRDIKIIAVSTFYNPGVTRNLPSSPLAFPSLQSLLIQDLYFNTMESLLQSIAPGSHCLNLFLTRRSLELNLLNENIEDVEDDANGQVFTSVNSLAGILAHTPVDTLMICGAPDGSWLTGPELRMLLISMPSMKTLKMNDWDLDNALWRALRRSQRSQLYPKDHQFPAFKNIHLTFSTILGLKGFRHMVASHPIQRVVLGAIIPVETSDESSGWESCGEDDGISRWLKSNVASFRLVDSGYQPPEFISDLWQLW